MTTEIQDINRETYDHVTQTEYTLKVEPGLSEEVVRLISKEKNEPEWLLQKRLECLKIYNKMPMPNWGPSLKNLDLNKITFFARADAKQNARNWDDVPEEIKNTFEKLGIPEAERKALAGAGAQFESETIYHNLKKYHRQTLRLRFIILKRFLSDLTFTLGRCYTLKDLMHVMSTRNSVTPSI